MNNMPGAAQLLAIARETLLSELLPRAGGEARYLLLMIANAMAIAAREIEDGETSATAELARLDALYGRRVRELHGQALRDAIGDAEGELARDIRTGLFDSDERRRALMQHLRQSVAARLRLSNPKSLKG